MWQIRRAAFAILGGLALSLLAACAAASEATPTIEPEIAITPYITATASLPAVSPTIAQIVLSPTPRLYTVVQNDTFFSIAAILDVDLDALRAANPEVNPNSLSIGTVLIIPANTSNGEEGGIATPTPAAVIAGETRCYQSAAQELWCMLAVTNPGPQTLENVLGVIQVLDADGKALATLDAQPPLDILGAGQSMPLVGYIKEAPQGWASAVGQVQSAYLLAEADELYLPVTLTADPAAVSESGLAAQISGEVEVSGAAETLWVVAVAYDKAGNVAGVAKWESDGDTQFDLWVYSLGPKIVRVELLAEARP